MKKHLIAAILVTGLCVVSYNYGKSEYEKVYEDACHMSDLIRCYQDHLDNSESVVKDYGLFGDLEGDFLIDDSEKPINLDNYVWAY